MDGPIAEMATPENRRCAVCGAVARYYFGGRVSPLQTTEGWYCGTHLHEGERAWVGLTDQQRGRVGR